MEAQPRPRRSTPTDAAQKIGTACTVLPNDHSGVNRVRTVCDLWNAVGGAGEKSTLARGGGNTPHTPFSFAPRKHHPSPLLPARRAAAINQPER